MKRALITGVTGQDGSYLAELLLKKGYKVYGVTRRLSTPNYTYIRHILDKITIIDADMSDASSLSRAVHESQPDEVYNLAAQSFVQTSFAQPLYTADVTGVGVLRLLEAVRQMKPDAKFYQASSSELYGNTKHVPQSETTPFYPRSPYAVAKIMGYWATVNYREAYNLFAVNGILFNHESPRRGLEFVTRKISHGVAMIQQGLADHISLGNLDAQRDWGYAPEYVNAMWLMMQHKTPEDFVVATGETHSVREFAKKAFEVAGISKWENKIKIDKQFHRPAEVSLLKGDPSKAEKVLGWKHSTKFEELVELMVKADIQVLEGKATDPVDVKI